MTPRSMLSTPRALLLVALLGAGPTGCVLDDADRDGAAILDLSATAAATDVNVFHVAVDASVEVAFTSVEPAVLTVSVDGAEVQRATLDVSSSRTADAAFDVPLAAGANAIELTLRYGGATSSQGLVVTAGMTAPTVTLPTWASTFTPDVGLDLTGTIAVAADPAYQVLAVETSLAGDPWQPAVLGADGWTATLTNPDLGTSDVAVRVTTGIGPERAVLELHDTVDVAPIFDCGDGASMSPSTLMFRSNGTEQRVMRGYFGRPSGGHDVTFALFAQGELGDVTVVSAPVLYGTTALHVAYGVTAMRCNSNQNDCDLPYDLTAYVDGVQVCTQPDFGAVRSFN